MESSDMHETINTIYEKFAKAIKIRYFYPSLPKQIDGMSVGLDYELDIGEDPYRFVKFKVNDLIVICIIIKSSKSSKKYKKTIDEYHIKCVGTNNTVDIFDHSFAFGIRSTSAVIQSRGIDKSSLPGLEQGTIVTKTSNALMEYFKPEAFTRIDAAEISCKNGTKFYLSWFRLLTKPTNTDDLSWYNSFGLKRLFPYVSNKKRLTDTIDRIKNITAKELETYCEKVHDLFSTKKYESVQMHTHIPNGYFIYYTNSLLYSSILRGWNHPRDNYKKSIAIIKKESPSTTFSEILQKASCEERATLFSIVPYHPTILGGFYDTELKKEAVFPQLSDIVTMVEYMVWNNRTYAFTRKKKRNST
jgi:hypothetical protein